MGIIEVSEPSEGELQAVSTARKLTQREKALVGKCVVGRLFIHTPKRGLTRYYLNWTKNRPNNIRVDPEIIEKCLGSDKVQNGMAVMGTISHLGPEHRTPEKRQPYAGSVALVPTRKPNRRRGRMRRPRRAGRPNCNRGGRKAHKPQRKQRSRCY